MSKIFRKISACFSLLCRGRLFILCQAIFAALIPSRFFGLNKQIFYKLQHDKKTLVQNIDEFNIAAGNESTVTEIVNDLYLGDPAMLKFYENFYHDGIEPYVAKSNGKVIGSIWLYTGSYLANWEGYDSWLLQIGVESTAKFVANVFVDPAWRGKRIFPAIVDFCTSAYCDSEFYSCVEELNNVSVRAHERIGFRKCAIAYYIRFGQKTYCIFVTKNKNGNWKRKYLKLPRGIAVNVSITEQ
jgi:GNAT superfamily N-acetyltransferase